jgi:26S proteasome regulatory subunit T1
MGPRLDWEKAGRASEEPKEKVVALDEDDIALLKSYGQGPYASDIKRTEKEVQESLKRVDERLGVKESETGLAPPNLWDLNADKRRVQEEQTLQVARCTKIIKKTPEEPVSLNDNEGKFHAIPHVYFQSILHP